MSTADTPPTRAPATAPAPPAPFTLSGHRALRWGGNSEHALLAVHGMSGDKADPVITAVARAAALAGYTTISVDLPGHGDRSDREALTPWAYRGELAEAAREVSAAHRRLSLFACSLGAFMALHALAQTPLDQALFASPLVDMEAFIARKMTLQGISERELRARRHVPLADGQSLDWGYLTWVRRHPVRWHHPTSVLYGRSDAIVPRPDIDSFTRATGAQLQVIPAGHYLHTPHDLAVLRHWVTGRLTDVPARPTGTATRLGNWLPDRARAVDEAALRHRPAQPGSGSADKCDERERSGSQQVALREARRCPRLRT